MAEIRELHRLDLGELTHAVVGPGQTSDVAWLDQRTEIFYIHSGTGQFWVHDGRSERTVNVRPGRSLLVPAGARFQYRTPQRETLTLLLTVLPRWKRANHHASKGGPWAASRPSDTERDVPPSPSRSEPVILDLPAVPDTASPDGSQLRLLPSCPDGGLAHYTLHPALRTRTARHRTVTQIWYVLDGSGELARWDAGPDTQPRRLLLVPQMSVGLPARTAFQIRTTGVDPLRMLLLTMPAWPGPGEADPSVEELEAWPNTYTAR